jgi:hypothetical protein
MSRTATSSTSQVASLDEEEGDDVAGDSSGTPEKNSYIQKTGVKRTRRKRNNTDKGRLLFKPGDVKRAHRPRQSMRWQAVDGIHNGDVKKRLQSVSELTKRDAFPSVMAGPDVWAFVYPPANASQRQCMHHVFCSAIHSCAF